MSLNIAGSVQSILQPLSIVSRVTPTRSTLPILGCVKITGKGDHAEIVGTDHQVTVRTIAHDVTAEGEGLVQATKLQSLLRSIPIGAQRVAITADSTSTRIQCGGKYKCASVDPADFPDIRFSLKVEEEGINIKTDSLIGALQQVAHAMAKQDVRHYLNGTFLDYCEGMVDCVTTDGHRLARRIISVPAGPYSPAKFIIPSYSVGIVAKSLTAETSVIAAGRNEDNEISHIVFESGDTWIASALISGKYPDYKRVIQGDYVDEIKIHRQDFIDACHRCQIFSDQKAMGIHIKINGSAVISCKSFGGEDFAEEEIPITRQDTRELTTFLNSTYLLDGVSNFDSDYFILKPDPPNKIMLTPCSDSASPDDIELIMGMRE